MIRRALLLNFRVLHKLDRWVQRRFTAAGKLVLGAMVASAVFGIDTSTTMASQLFTLSAMLVGLALLCSWRLKTRVEVRRDAPRYATVGEPVSYRVLVKNRNAKLLTGLWVEEQVKDRLPAHEEFVPSPEPGRRRRNFFDHYVGYPRWAWLVKRARGAVTRECQLPSIPANDSASVDVSLTPIRRGYIRLAGLDIFRHESLGLCKTRQRVGDSQSILVLPKRYDISWHAQAGNRATMVGSSNTQHATGGAQDFSRVREYRSHDPIRLIHWASSARFGQLIVKEFHQQSDSRLALVLDTFTADAGQQFEEAISIAASFAHVRSAGRQTVDTLFTVDEIIRIETGHGASGAARMLETLACVEECTDRTFSTLGGVVETQSAAINAAVCVLLDWDEPRQRLVQVLRNCGISVLIIVVTPSDGVTPPEPGVMSDRPQQFRVIAAGEVEQHLSGLTFR